MPQCWGHTDRICGGHGRAAVAGGLALPQISATAGETENDTALPAPPPGLTGTDTGEAILASGFVWHILHGSLLGGHGNGPHLQGESIVIDQEDGTLKIKPQVFMEYDKAGMHPEFPAKLSQPPQSPMRAVSSGSTLCSLSDLQECL